MKPSFSLAVASSLAIATALTACSALIGVNDLFPAVEAGADASAGDDAHADAVITTPASDAATESSALDAGSDVSACGDTSAEPKNCGRCGHDCLGGECKAGKCQPAQMFKGTDRLYGIAVDNTSVYFTDYSSAPKGAIYKLPKLAVNGVPTKLSETDDELVYDIAVDGTSVFFSSGSGTGVSAVEKCSTIGGAKTTLLPGTGTVPRGLAIDANNVYWANTRSTPVTIASAPKTLTGAPVTLAPSEGDVATIHVAGTRMFWTVQAFAGALRACTLPACTDRADISAALPYPYAVSSNSTTVFFSGGDAIHHVPRTATAGAMRVTAATGQKQPFQIFADDKDVFWVNLGFQPQFDGDVRRCPIVGGAPQCVGEGEIVATTNLGRSIAGDATAIYWTSDSQSAVFRLAR